jgi:hypothetical protein
MITTATNSAAAALAVYRAAERASYSAQDAVDAALRSKHYGDAKAILVEDAYERKFAADRLMHETFMAYLAARDAA